MLLAGVALIWLRRVLHLGLLQEAAEIETGPDIQCANCGATTPRHAFCINCGVSLLALPNARRADRRDSPIAEPPAAPATGGEA